MLGLAGKSLLSSVEPVFACRDWHGYAAPKGGSSVVDYRTPRYCYIAVFELSAYKRSLVSQRDVFILSNFLSQRQTILIFDYCLSFAIRPEDR